MQWRVNQAERWLTIGRLKLLPSVNSILLVVSGALHWFVVAYAMMPIRLE